MSLIFAIAYSLMFIRLFFFLLVYLSSSIGLAQQSSDSTDESSQQLQLNLEQFSDSDKQPENEELQLNLEQFEQQNQAVTINSEKSETSGDLQLNLEQFNSNDKQSDDLELNIEQFDKSTGKSQSQGESSKQINNSGSGAVKIEKSGPPKYKYSSVFIVCALVLLVVLFILFRKRRGR